MAAVGPYLKYKVQEMLYDPKSMLDEQNFYNQRQGSPSELSKKITYILGDYTKRYPISGMTLGAAGYNPSLSNASVELDDIQFTYPVMGRMSKPGVVAENPYVAGTDKPGIGNSPFKIILTDNWIKRFKIIQTAGGVQLYVLEEPTPHAKGFEYLVKLHAAGAGDFCPVPEIESGMALAELNSAVAESESDTTESKMVMPGMYKNQMTVMRGGLSWAGNAANKVMKINMETDKGKTDVWMDYAMWQMEQQWMEECEHMYWYSRYNRQVNGTVDLKDLATGKIIPTGSGLLEQIVNRSTYSDLTYTGLSNLIGDALFGQTDTANMSITLYTGTGGRRVFHQALLKAGATFLQDFGMVADKFVTGTGRSLMLGGFFDGFYHIDGYTIKIKYNPLFDTGRVAEAQRVSGRVHPESGLPLESYRMVFVDDADYDGQPNIQIVHQKGRAFMHGVVAGITNLPKSLQILGNFNLTNEQSAGIISSTKDKASYTRLKTAGISMKRGNRCFDLICTAGL